MMIYGFFMGLALLGLVFFAIGIMQTFNLWALVGPALGSPGFLPESLGWHMISFFIMFFTIIGIFARIKMVGVSKRFDRPPRGKAIFNFMYRDGDCMDILGERRPGMGIYDVEGHGVIVDVGRLPAPGSVYRQGGKTIRHALQDINYTPNPLFTNIYTFFTDLGINNGEELQDVLNGNSPMLMAKVWNKLCEYHPKTMEDTIVENIQQMSKQEIKLLNRDWKNTVGKDKKKKELDHDELDKILEKAKGGRK